MADKAQALRPGSALRTASHGRGGAGNRRDVDATPKTDAADLATPTIKAATYTTGRGGQGNMASNTCPTLSRAAQDVEAPAAHSKEGPTQGTFHWGRGGQGNMTTIGQSGAEQERAKSRDRKLANGNKEGRSGSFLEKSREMLGFGKKEKEAARAAAEEGSAFD